MSIIGLAGQAPPRRRPLSSNVRRRKAPCPTVTTKMNPLSALAGLTKIKFISERVAKLRDQARGQLRSVKVSSSSRSHALDGATAEVMSESENVVQQEGTVEWYYLTQVVRNEAGEYFLLKTTDYSPFIKHLAQSRAKLVLKGKYKAPAHVAPNSDA